MQKSRKKVGKKYEMNNRSVLDKIRALKELIKLFFSEYYVWCVLGYSSTVLVIIKLTNFAVALRFL